MDLRDDEFAGVEQPTAGISGKALASFVIGFLVFGMFLTGLWAVSLGREALREIEGSKGRLKGAWLARVGIVMGVISTLFTVSLLLPMVRSAREAARRSQCVNNLKLIGLALHNYHSDHGCYPPAAITDAQGRPLLSWRVLILPYMESNSIYNRFHLDEPWDSPHNLALVKEMPNSYACPSDPRAETGKTPYQVIVDRVSAFTPDFKGLKSQDITDGLSNTIMVGETRRVVTWTAPDDLPFARSVPQSGFDSFHSNHFGGFNALFGDGSVRYIKPSINRLVFAALVTRDGGEPIAADSF